MSTANPRPHTDDLDLGETIRGLASGTVIFGRFVVEKILGRGGMGVVWLARDQKIGEDVALKFMPEIISADPASTDDLRKETRNGRNLNHPNIVRMIDLVEDGPAAAIVMEYVDGKTLASMRLDQPEHVFETSVLRPWTDQMLDALEHAHRDARLIHRDLKPANLMVNSADQLKVADFGIASSIRDSVSRVSRKASSGAGTLPYMSPQQMMGEVPTFTDDIYSLGATLYELLTGKPPFYAGDLAKQIETTIPPLVSERRKQFGIEGEPVPKAWEEVIAACLEKDPRDRPADIAAVRTGLTGQKFKRASGTNRATTRRVNRTRSSFPAAAVAVAAVIVLLAGAAAYAWGVYFPREAALKEKKQREIIARREAEQKRTEADEKLAEHQNKVAAAKRKEDGIGSAIERLALWQEVKNSIDAFDYEYSDEEDQLKATAQTGIDKATADKEKEEKEYTDLVEKKQEKLKELTAYASKPEVGAEPKHKKWREFVTAWKDAEFNAAYGRKHETIITEARAEDAKWEKAVKDENEKAQPIVGFPMCFDDGPIAQWDKDEKVAAIAMIQNVLQAAGLRKDSPNGIYADEMHFAIVSYQRKRELPVNGKLDQHTLKAMQVRTDVPPKKQMEEEKKKIASQSTTTKSSGSGSSTRKSSGGGGGSSRSSQGSSGGGSSEGSYDWTQWLNVANKVHGTGAAPTPVRTTGGKKPAGRTSAPFNVTPKIPVPAGIPFGIPFGLPR